MRTLRVPHLRAEMWGTRLDADFGRDFGWRGGRQIGRSGCACTPAHRLRSGQSGSAFGAAVLGAARTVPFRFGGY
jgi:hypothetical protein